MSFINWKSFIYKLSFTRRGPTRGITLPKTADHHRRSTLSFPKTHAGRSPSSSPISHLPSGPSFPGRRR